MASVSLSIDAALSAEATQPAPGAASGRVVFIDNVRSAMILLVLSMHAADTYSPFGNWYYTERADVSFATKLFFLTYQSGLQAFFMALLFFIAGYFTPRSFDAKGPGSFLAGRLYRLGLPTLLYVVLIGPVTEFYIAHSWRTKQTFLHEMGLYFTRARFLGGTGPMWFCEALLIFSVGYGLYRVMARGGRRAPAPPNARGVQWAIALLTSATFAVRTVWPSGRSLFNLQLADFASYVILFAVGVAASRGGWLTQVRDRFAGITAAVCLVTAAVIWLPLLVLGGAPKAGFADYGGGWHWQSLALCFWEALVCIGMAFGVLTGFRRFAHSQGPIARWLSENAFAVYVIHPPVLIAVALALSGLPWPPIPKFLLLWALSVAACFALAAPLVRRVPILGVILR